MKHIIWTNISRFQDSDDLDYERWYINKYADKLDNDIILIADADLWSGRHTGYKIINSGNIADCLSTDYDYAEWYVDNYKNLRCTTTHCTATRHGGRNEYLYREIKDNLSDRQIENFLGKICDGTVTNKDITRYTRRIGDKICKIYGW